MAWGLATPWMVERGARMALSLKALSLYLGGPYGRNDIALRIYALWEFEEVAIRGQDKGRVFGGHL
jgi:hypothetical protein